MDPETKIAPVDESPNMFLYSHSEVDQDLSYLSAFEDEVTRLQHYLPECSMDCLDGTVDFETFNSLKGFNIGSFSCAFKYDQIKFDGDALELYFAQEGEETKGNSKRMLVTNEKTVIGDFSLHSTCEETILNTEPVDEVPNLNYSSWEKSCLGGVDLESNSPHFKERDCHAEMSDLSSSRVFSRIFGCETLVMDKQWLKHCIVFGLQNQGELIDGLDHLECGTTSKVNEGKAVHLTCTALSGIAPDSTEILGAQLMSAEKHVKREKLTGCNSLESMSSPVRDVGFCSLGESNPVDVIVTRQQTHRPTRTCTKRLEQQDSRYQHLNIGAFYKNRRDEFLHVRSHKQHHEKGSGTSQMICQEECLRGSSVQVPLELSVQIGHLTKSTSLVDDFDNCNDEEVSVSNEDFDKETSSADSQDNISKSECVKRRRGLRKKRQRHQRWTTCEVMKLIEGVSKFGVGKWTHIKKSLFSSSSHRTSVNLKDKWRNLLKASSNETQKRRKVEQEQTHASHQLPDSVWRQVRELAVIYSYPRKSKSKVSCTSLASSTPSYYC
ncbi:uncharacterized protein LOC105628060 isoform X2 [Jatropha curcas]|uniref:uncharacterized protein LOC105628060 isoform X2 n=1 Tax=Jatropha curcas TaxID=180498 RepID=UPI0005FB84BD|nr:uncharacterized protein LOC105628060 isoform X2 [Jatropha curcas]